MPKVIAHRGASGLAPENTLPAIRAAIDAGADGVEFDVLLSRDGVAVVHHDYRVSPALARGADGRWIAPPGPPVRSLTFAQLRGFDVGRVDPASPYAARYPDYAPADGARIPTLAETLALVREAAPPAFELWIELKVDPTRPDVSPDPGVLAAATVAGVRAAGLTGRTTFISFFWPVLAAVRELEPAARLGLITAEQPWLDNLGLGEPGVSPWIGALDLADVGHSVPDAAKRLGAAVWSAHWRDMTAGRMARARALGLETGLWTIRTEPERRAALALRPDVVTTDRPDWRFD